MAIDKIVIKGAREHNLKNIDIEIPRDKLVVMTGLSGSGKSSLAFDTIYADGQRRYVESLSSYARMFLGQMEKPDVEKIEGLSPSTALWKCQRVLKFSSLHPLSAGARANTLRKLRGRERRGTCVFARTVSFTTFPRK